MGKLKSWFQRITSCKLKIFGIECGRQILDQLCIEVLFVIGLVVISQLAANLAGLCFGLEAISNQETFKDAFGMIRRRIVEA